MQKKRQERDILDRENDKCKVRGAEVSLFCFLKREKARVSRSELMKGVGDVTSRGYGKE